MAPPDSPADDQWDPTDGESGSGNSPWWFDPAELTAGGKYGAPPLEPSAEERARIWLDVALIGAFMLLMVSFSRTRLLPLFLSLSLIHISEPTRPY